MSKIITIPVYQRELVSFIFPLLVLVVLIFYAWGISLRNTENNYNTRIEPVGKPYREVCLRSELWHWMAHQPNCIELLFCLTVTMTFGVQT